MGYTIDPDTGVRSSTTLTNISFPTGAPIAAKQTSKVTAVMNLDARAEIAGPTHNRATYGTSVEVFDSLGAPMPCPSTLKSRTLASGSSTTA